MKAVDRITRAERRFLECAKELWSAQRHAEAVIPMMVHTETVFQVVNRLRRSIKSFDDATKELKRAYGFEDLE